MTGHSGPKFSGIRQPFHSTAGPQLTTKRPKAPIKHGDPVIDEAARPNRRLQIISISSQDSRPGDCIALYPTQIILRSSWKKSHITHLLLSQCRRLCQLCDFNKYSPVNPDVVPEMYQYRQSYETNQLHYYDLDNHILAAKIN